MEVGGGGRERDSGDQRWRKVGEAASVWCEKVMATPRRTRARLLSQQKWSLQGIFGCPPQIGSFSRGLLEYYTIFSLGIHI